MSQQTSNAINPSQNIQQASIKNGLILGLFALVSTGLIAITHHLTKEKISIEIENAMARRLNQVITADKYDNNVYQDCLMIDSAEYLHSANPKAYRMRKNNQNYAVFISSIAPDGYSGSISLVTGIYADGTIAGVRVTDHKETPGLGDRIEIKKSNWLKQFDHLSLQTLASKNWAVKKDGGQFDALTGATITPRAIIKAVNKTLIYYQHNKTQLFSLRSNCEIKSGSDKS